MRKITVRMADHVHADLQAQAAAAGVSMEAFIRGLIVARPYAPQLVTRPVLRHPTLAAKTIRDENGRRLVSPQNSQNPAGSQKLRKIVSFRRAP